MKKLSILATTAAVLASGVMSAAPAKAGQFTGRQVIDFSSKYRNNGTINNFGTGKIINGNEWSNQGLSISVDTNKNGTGDRDIDDSKRLTLYDTTSSGRDNDLRTGSEWGTEEYGGKALIIQETWKSTGSDVNNWVTNSNGKKYLNPDDDASGGTITFDFLRADDLYIYEDLNIGLLDIDGPESAKITVFYTDEEGNQQQASELLNASDPDASSNVTLLSSRELWDEIDEYNENNPNNKKHHNNSLWNFNFDVDSNLKGLVSLDKVEVKYSGSGAVAYLDYNRFEKATYAVEVPEPGSVMALLALGAFGGHSVLKRKKH
ncbi:MAG: PEP-CTERM sorting domain-containing protein [Cyanobacteria bacterium J06592_8]